MIELTKGERFGQLTIIREVAQYIGPINPLGKRSRSRRFLCKCDCGNKKEINMGQLRGGGSKSCGCLRITAVIKSNERRSNKSRRYHPLFATYHAMIRRCYKTSDSRYKDYGGRGITVCKEWRHKSNGINNFLIWTEACPSYRINRLLDRRDNYRGYSPDNCRFVSPKRSSRNRRNNIWVKYKGKQTTLIDCVDRFGVSGLTRDKAYARYMILGWTLERTLKTP